MLIAERTPSNATDELPGAAIRSEVSEPVAPLKQTDHDAPATPTVNEEEPMLFELPAPAKQPITAETWGSSGSVDELNRQICHCTKCALGFTRTNFVFGVGNPNATLMLIGEAPGADEDAQGEPFVGRAGQLLNKILEAINFKRSEVYICNILKCRPPNNRKPTPEESELCKPYLKKQIDLIKPKVILCLGLTAAENLLGTTESMSRLRGRVMQYEGVPVMITYHPAALLRNPNWKRPAWEDVQAVRKLHDELVKG
ncbi:MAG: uracil-DNA glycosylase [Ignavibacteriae bacterium]|nr:uracil-DNA glycosylase [Ignavibacteriota bacterium]